MESIEKRYLISKEDAVVEIILEDIRDNYVVKDALGQIGSIYVSPHGTVLGSKSEYGEEKLNELRNKKLIEAFREIFQTEDYDPLSRKYYDKIMIMIQNGELESLGYTKEEPLDLDDDFSFGSKRKTGNL